MIPGMQSLFLRQGHRSRMADCYVMDKGYDSEEIYRQIREELNIDSLIPVRDRKRINGRQRVRLA